jgi:carbonic anhydrase
MMKDDPGKALNLLKEGNSRFLEGRPEGPNCDQRRRVLTSSQGQNPFAAVVACSDSRMPVSILFDRGIGDIFTVRVAGNVLGEMGSASIEYAVQHLGIRLLVLLGHSSCGAVQAALAGASPSLCINRLVQRITPAVNRVLADSLSLTSSELVDAVARTNVWLQAEDLFNNNQIVRNAVETERLLLTVGFFHLATGKVEWMGQYPRKIGS